MVKEGDGVGVSPGQHTTSEHDKYTPQVNHSTKIDGGNSTTIESAGHLLSPQLLSNQGEKTSINKDSTVSLYQLSVK